MSSTTAHFTFRCTAGGVWPSLFDASAIQIRYAYQQLELTQWMRAEELLQAQLRQLGVLLQHARSQVPYYRQVFRDLDVKLENIDSYEDFRCLPLLPRRVYQERSAEFLAESLPAGCVATLETQTSGSSGSPTRVFQTNVVNLWWYAFFLRDLQWSGIRPTGRIASIRSTGKRGIELQPYLTGIETPCWLPPLQSLIEMGTAHLMDISRTPDAQLDWLHRVAPDYLVSYPANLAAIATASRKTGPLPNLLAIQSISDTLTHDVEHQITNTFGVPVKNTYSCAEAGYLASPCPLGHGLHVHSENVLLEVVDQAGNPCQPGESGDVLITTLQNLRAPLIRYELGDRVTLAAGPCPCGRSLPLLAQIHGKESPMFHLPNGQVKSSARLSFQVRKVGGHWQHQVIQRRPDQILVKLATTSDWSDAHVVRLKHEIETFFESPMKVQLETDNYLTLPENGKFQNMILEMQ